MNDFFMFSFVDWHKVFGASVSCLWWPHWREGRFCQRVYGNYKLWSVMLWRHVIRVMMTLQDDVEVIKQTLESVLRENQRLHLKVEQTDATDAPYNMTEWCAPPSPSLPHSLPRVRCMLLFWSSAGDSFRSSASWFWRRISCWWSNSSCNRAKRETCIVRMLPKVCDVIHNTWTKVFLRSYQRCCNS